MKIFLHEIKELEREWRFSEKDSWVETAVRQAEEEPATGPLRPSQFKVRLKRIKEFFMLSGELQTGLRLLCSRCGKPIDHAIDSKFTTLYTQDAKLADLTDSYKEEFQEETSNTDITFLHHNYIDLSEALSEQLILEIPYQPLCSEDCTFAEPGVMIHLNGEPLPKLLSEKLGDKRNPFTVLKNLRSGR